MTTDASLDAIWERAQRQFNDSDFHNALASCGVILKRDPQHSGAHLMLSMLTRTLGKYRLATAHALTATERLGRQPIGHIAALARQLLAVGEYEACASLALKVNPITTAAPSTIAEFAQILSLLERHDDALRYLDAAIAQGLSGDWVHYHRGNFLKFVGRLEDAALAYERCLADNPAFALAHLALAYLDRGGDPAVRIDRVTRLLGRLPAEHADVAPLQYALFKDYDKLDDTARAWPALAAGARAKRASLPYDASGETATFDAIRRACGPRFLTGAEPVPAGPTPIFVVGMPRTGTTLLERIIGGSGEVALFGELNDFRMQYKWMIDRYSPGHLDLESAGRIGEVDYATLGQRYLAHVRWRAPSASHFTDKNPNNFTMVGLILKALPQARVIHIRREPMDSCFSNLKELFAANAHPYSYDFAGLAHHYRAYSRLMGHWHEIAPGRILDVRYEDLVSAPEATARTVMAHCGLAYRDEQVRVEASALPVSTASSAQVREPIHSRNVGGWRRYAGPLAPLQALLGDAD